MGFKPKTIVLDSVTGYYDLALQESLGDSNAGLWGTNVQWGPITGSWRRDVACMREINRKHGIIVGVVAHIEPKELRATIGYDKLGKPIKDTTIVGWKLTTQGKGDRVVLAAFDEVYYLTSIATDAGLPPVRKLHTNKILIHDYEFEAKSRKSVAGPITNPTYDKIIAAVKPGNDAPTSFVVGGAPGEGKTTLFGTFPGDRLFVDMLGGCEEMAKLPGTRVIAPKKLSEVFDVLKQIRDKGELAN